jgi:hypothetical protein
MEKEAGEEVPIEAKAIRRRLEKDGISEVPADEMQSFCARIFLVNKYSFTLHVPADIARVLSLRPHDIVEIAIRKAMPDIMAGYNYTPPPTQRHVFKRPVVCPVCSSEGGLCRVKIRGFLAYRVHHRDKVCYVPVAKARELGYPALFEKGGLK